MRLIDADELIKALASHDLCFVGTDGKVHRYSGEKDKVCYIKESDVVNCLMNSSTIEYEPVVHATWKEFIGSAYHGKDEYGEPIFREVIIRHCSNCNRRTVIKEKYCPKCGAKMDADKATEPSTEVIIKSASDLKGVGKSFAEGFMEGFMEGRREIEDGKIDSAN